jgi:hypothetical protein
MKYFFVFLIFVGIVMDSTSLAWAEIRPEEVLSVLDEEVPTPSPEVKNILAQKDFPTGYAVKHQLMDLSLRSNRLKAFAALLTLGVVPDCSNRMNFESFLSTKLACNFLHLTLITCLRSSQPCGVGIIKSRKF